MDYLDSINLLNKTKSLEGTRDVLIWLDGEKTIEIEPEQASFRNPIVTLVARDGRRFAAGILREMLGDSLDLTVDSPREGNSTPDALRQFLDFYYRRQSELLLDEPTFRVKFERIERLVLARLGLVRPQ